MSKRAVEQVLMRAMSDADFRSALRTDPQHALVGYDLDAAERSVLLGQNAEALLDLGIDKRVVQMLPPRIILDDPSSDSG